MSAPDLYPASDAFRARAHVGSREAYDEMYRRSVEDNEGFWAEQAERLDWFAPFETVKDVSYDADDLHIRWYVGGKLNACHNALDRHVEAGRGDRAAFFVEPDDPRTQERRTITYAEALADVQRMASVLKDHGVRKGDRVTIYMPMIPEAVTAMLACARIGAVFSVIFGGFSPEAIAGRIRDASSDFVITADQGRRGGKTVALKANVDAALGRLGDDGAVRHVLVVKNTGGNVTWDDGLDVWYHEAAEGASTACPCEPMDAEDPLFILYTSGSTGTPKGVVHTTGGYCVYTSLTHELTFDWHEDDVFWCSADVGWITGHSYIAFGPMINGATQVLFEGVPTFPDAGRVWDVVEEYGVSIFYTAPTLIRALMAQGDDYVEAHDRSSLRVLGTVGEPINPEAWRWYHDVVGEGRCPVVDTWWQTETGGHMLTPLPGAIDQKPGAATVPFFGIQPQVLDSDGNVLEGEAEGLLVIADSWPGQARTVYGNHERFKNTYFTAFPGAYFTGDGCRRDADGYFWITGRVDDVINVSGHRMGTAEVESALVLHDAVAEAAVVGVPHDIKGQTIYAYVTLTQGATPNEDLRAELRQHVRKVIGPIATPEFLQFAIAGLPKTRSGKIMRRILRKVATGEHDSIGDTSTLADPEVVDKLVQGRRGQPEDDAAYE